ncbi:MAG TPA: methionyl-tRNA formyltransferase [Ilumatobacteraceae bacterium]|nr:methionyl-tRNA formyltransferase [Ilumatobacteraceae bacterium]
MTLAPLPQGRPRRLVYFGTPEMAVAPLQGLVAAGFEVALVVTRADAKRGRGSALTPSPVKAAAERLGLPVSHSVDDALGAGADLGVVVAYGRLIKQHVLEALPMVNIHFSLLPRWRGAAPVERALLAGDEVTGVCLMQLDVGLDTGPVLARAEVPIGPRVTLAALRDELVAAGTEMLVTNLAAGLGMGVEQQGDATYAAKIDPAELRVDWRQPAVAIDRLVRLGGAWTRWAGKRLKLIEVRPNPAIGVHAAEVVASGTFVGPLRVATGDGSIDLVTVQPEGKPPMPAAAWANGARPQRGDTFESTSEDAG